MDKDVDDNGSNTAAGVLIINLVLLISGNRVVPRGTHAPCGSSIRARLFGAAWRMFGSANRRGETYEAVVWRPRYVGKVHDPLFLCDCGVPVPVYVCFFIRLSLGVAWDDV
jgi:hypothetical protein